MDFVAVYFANCTERNVVVLSHPENTTRHAHVALDALGERAHLLIVGVEDVHALAYLVLEPFSHVMILSEWASHGWPPGGSSPATTGRATVA
jgi:hypothetical protein